MEYSNNFEPNKIIVALNNHLEAPFLNISEILSVIAVEKVEYLFSSNKINTQNDNIGDVLLVYLKDKNKMAVLDAIQKLSTNPYIAYVEPDYLYDAHIIPYDPYFEDLWGMKKINSPLAWQYSIGNNNVVVGVLDSGIDYHHPDLKDNLWISPNARYINGWNFINDSSSPMDETGHGTHVAGTVGAVGNNFIGITGVCWNISIASFKIGNNLIDLAAAINAIYFANINNIPILNNSWGGRSYSPILKHVIEQYNGLFIASAGNNGTNNDFFPSYPASYDCDNIISVAASNQEDTLASFSNYGVKSVDIAAPGTGILSTDLYGEYSYKNGTSMSAPHVAGAAALLKSYMPYLTTFQIKNIILASSQKHSSLNGKILTGGILDVYSMIEMSNHFI